MEIAVQYREKMECGHPVSTCPQLYLDRCLFWSLSYSICMIPFLSKEAKLCKHSLFKCMKESEMLILGIVPLRHVSGLWLKMIVEIGLDIIYFAQERECL